MKNNLLQYLLLLVWLIVFAVNISRLSNLVDEQKIYIEELEFKLNYCHNYGKH